MREAVMAPVTVPPSSFALPTARGPSGGPGTVPKGHDSVNGFGSRIKPLAPAPEITNKLIHRSVAAARKKSVETGRKGVDGSAPASYIAVRRAAEAGPDRFAGGRSLTI